MTTISSPTAGQIVYEFQPTTPAGTSEDSPYTEAFTMPAYEVRLIQWVVPPGPQGNLGWQITYAGVPIVPMNGGWIITDNERNTFELDEQPNSGAWGFAGYNSGEYDHTVYLRFILDPLDTAVATPEVSGFVTPNWPFVAGGAVAAT